MKRVLVLLIVCAAAPAHAQVTTFDREYLRTIPVPGLDAEDVAEAAPGFEEGGIENAYVVDGMTTTGVVLPFSDTRVLADFADSIEVARGGWDVRWGGGATGGIVQVLTRRGADRTAGSAFAYVTPGALAGSPESTTAPGSPIDARTELDLEAVVGAEIGGPLVRRRVWYWIAAAQEETAYTVARATRRRVDRDGDGQPDVDGDGRLVTEVLDRRGIPARVRATHVLAKLDVAPTRQQDVRLSMSLIPSQTEGVRANGFVDQQLLETRRTTADLSASWTARLGERIELEALVGSHRAIRHAGSRGGARDEIPLQTLYAGGLAEWSRLGGESAATRDGCTDGTSDDPFPLIANCPAGAGYAVGGPGALVDAVEQRVEARAAASARVGKHHALAGVEGDRETFDNPRRFSGGRSFDNLGATITSYAWLDPQDVATRTRNLAAFVRDAWTPFPELTLEAGLRHDAQRLEDGVVSTGMWSPRLGLTWDHRRDGSRIFWLRWDRHAQSLPLSVNDRAFSPDTLHVRTFDASECGPPIEGFGGPDASSCQGGLDPFPPSPAVPHAVDPALAAQYEDEVSTGVDLELDPGVRVGASYRHRSLERVVEDIWSDGSLELSNPDAHRRQDALILTLDRRFVRGVGVRASYTFSRTTGNYTALPDTGQIDPHLTSQFDRPELEPNTTGPLPEDRRHVLALDAAYARALGPGLVRFGVRFRSLSGAPVDVRGRHPAYGASETLLLPRGAGGRTPSLADIDLRIGWDHPLDDDVRLELFADLLHALDAQSATALDESYSHDPVLPIVGGTTADLVFAKSLTSSPLSRNPAFGAASSRQSPVALRFGLRITF